MSGLQNSRALVSPSHTLRLCWSPPNMSWMFFLLHHCACILGHFSGVQICDPMHCSPPGSSVHGLLQVRILEWVAMPFRGSFRPKDWTPHLLRLLHWQVGSLPLAPPGKPLASLVSPDIKHALETEQRRRWHPTPVLLPWKFHGQRSLVGCRPWGRTELDTTEET